MEIVLSRLSINRHQVLIKVQDIMQHQLICKHSHLLPVAFHRLRPERDSWVNVTTCRNTLLISPKLRLLKQQCLPFFTFTPDSSNWPQVRVQLCSIMADSSLGSLKFRTLWPQVRISDRRAKEIEAFLTSHLSCGHFVQLCWLNGSLS